MRECGARSATTRLQGSEPPGGRGAPSRTSTIFARSIPLVRSRSVKGVPCRWRTTAASCLPKEWPARAGVRRAYETRAAALGLTDTHFVQPDRLPDPANRTTVRDMVTLARHLHRLSGFLRLLSLRISSGQNYQRNRNPMLARRNGADFLATGFA